MRSDSLRPFACGRHYDAQASSGLGYALAEYVLEQGDRSLAFSSSARRRRL